MINPTFQHTPITTSGPPVADRRAIVLRRRIRVSEPVERLLTELVFGAISDEAATIVTNTVVRIGGLG